MRRRPSVDLTPIPEDPLRAEQHEAPVPFSRRVYRVVRRIPPGQVISYGGVAALLGVPRAARGVGQALKTLPQGSDVPWWRVLNRSGAVSLHGHPGLLQRQMLEAEGVRFARGRVDWERFGWTP